MILLISTAVRGQMSSTSKLVVSLRKPLPMAAVLPRTEEFTLKGGA